GEAQEQAQRESRTEDARAVAAHQRGELIAEQPGEQHCQNRIQAEQERVVPREQRRLAARGGKQEQHDRGDHATDEEQQLHRATALAGSRLSTGAGCCCWGRSTKRFQGDSRFSSRLVSAESWKGLGRSAVSSRIRTAAS